jgi:hypothetical protein
MEQNFQALKTIPGASKGAIYIVVAEDPNIMVAVKPEAQMVYFDKTRRFFQIGLRVHVRPQEGKALPPRDGVAEYLNIGYLSKREDNDRYVGQLRIPACNLTLSPWVVQQHIVEDKLIEKLVDGLYDRLSGASGLTLIVGQDDLLTVLRERFLDMIPDNKVPLPEVKVYFGKDSYGPPEPDGPPAIGEDYPDSNVGDEDTL